MSTRPSAADLATELTELEVQQDARILDGSLPQDVATLLRLEAHELANSDARRRAGSAWTSKWNRSKKTTSIAHRTLPELLEEALRLGFLLAVSRYKDAVAERMQELKKLASTRKQRQENGQLLAAEGREKRKAIATRRAATICRLYKKYRHTYPSGRAGNAKTLRKVCRLHGPLPGKDNPITVQAVRAILKKSGIRCR